MNRDRAYYESVIDQNRERFADELRLLLAEQPEFFKTLHQLLNMPNTKATAFLENCPKRSRKEVMKWIIPAARIGMAISTVTMEDKYSDDGQGGGE